MTGRLGLAQTTFCVIDLETTGLSPTLDRATEIAAVRFCGGEVVGSLVSLLNPERPVPARIRELTGIDDALVQGAPTLDDLAETLRDFIGDAVVVGHNVGFDLAFVAAASTRAGIGVRANRVVDTARLARRLISNGDVADRRLATLAEALGLDHRPSHRALPDVRATADLFHHLIGTAPGLDDVDDLDDLDHVNHGSAHTILRRTAHLPRGAGVYVIEGPAGGVLRVGAAGDLRRAVRARLSAPGRYGAALLPQVREIRPIMTPTPLEASVLALRMRQRLRPPANRASTMWPVYRYVRVPLAKPGAASVVAQPRPGKGVVHVGPVWSAATGREVVTALRDASEALGPVVVSESVTGESGILTLWLSSRVGAASDVSPAALVAARSRAGLVGAVLSRQRRRTAMALAGESTVRSGGVTLDVRDAQLVSPALSAAGFGPSPMDFCEPGVVPRDVLDEADLLAGLLG